ncbi:uncharacterized protein BDZ99DRAFT_395569 [Mytilinidion resinicola]|uniref:Protein kinase domain-containing protein n=1 Tax=Mytilinidion resinicola TaxID=574789 RepID=A0A6A6YB34_9PEZI|nr:uncharacterized protein BDZ99DRAFT_395569 [Mytilinidion resinicola]KAF2805713.1 hypothetical protein BDZ99DRAFT_395569 [Mytilinidion resinicola]
MNVTLHHRSAETAFYNTTYGTDKFIPGTTAQEDELFSNTLYSHIRHSVFDSSVRKFLPEGTLDMILNRDSVFEAMEVEGPNVDDESLADFVLAYARRVFAISIYIGLEDAKLRKAMLLCKEHGINDRKLPIAYTQDVSLNVLARLENSVDQKRRIWNLRRINKFCEEQWSFLAPVFSTAIFNHDLHPNAVLPFTRKHDIVNGSFGQVYKYEIHPHHFKDPLNPSCPDFFAVKEMRSVEKVVANWEREVKTLVMLNSLNQDHIVRFITAFSRRQADREDYCLMFEWANGGNLCDFWKATPQPTLQASFVKAVLKQLLGLAKALCAAHYLNTSGASIRHGDLKPENILWFQDLDEIGRLKIGDWGIAKQNNIGTEMRAEQTTSQWGTLRYAAPEVETGVRGIYFGQTPKRRSRLYDVWAMGCITLEFIIWLLYGWAEVKRLRFNLGGERAPFYQISQDESGTKIARVHSVAVQWMEHMAKDPACQAGTTALGDLLEVVKTGLLVVNLPRRMGSNLMNPQEALFNPFSLDARPHKQLPDEPDEPVLLEPSDPQETPLRGMPIPSLEITEPVRVPLLPEPEIRRDVRFLATDLRNRLENILVGDYESDNYWSPDAPRLPPPESPDDPSNSLTQGETEYRTESTALSISDLLASKGLLDNDWEIHVDNKFASRLLASHVATFEGSSSYESAQNHEALRLCSQCKYVRDDLWSPGFSITYEVRSLKARATLKECGLCGLFWRTCEKHSGTTFPTVQFGRVESSLKMNGGNTNVLSLLRSPDLNTRIDDHIQIGHAELPKAGQPAHLEVIRQWLNNCDDNHKHSTCQPPKHDSRFNDKRKLPTRLIDVGKAGDTTVRLLETGANDSGEWVALSHPWGPSPHFVTTRNNLAEHIKGINLKTLAGTFRDAVVVTRALGRRYLWIDCVCIIQGRDGDFIQEVKRMEEVFSGAYCVIQANCASDHFSGFLQPRNVRDYVALRRDGGAFFYICEMIDDFESHVLEGALNQRAWILQEHALARRTIFFTEHQTYWECGEGVRCETGMRMNNNLAALLGDPNFPQLVEAAPFGERILRYQDLYATYSRLLLVNPADRPLAIRGLEIRLLRTMQARGGFGVFDQGPNKGLLCRSLLWHRGDDEATLHRINFPPERGGVPSWSWMAYTGGIDYLGIEFGQVEWEDVTLHWLESKAVAVAGGARTEIVEDDERVGRALRAVVREYDTGAADVGGGRLVLDTPGGSEKLETLCVVLGRQKQQGAKTEDRNCYVLVVANAGGGEARRSRWERVGAGILPMKCIASEGEDIEIY